MTAALVAAAVVFGLLLSFAVCVLIGSAIARADEREPRRTELPDWLADLDLTPDLADVPFRPQLRSVTR